MTKLDRKLDRAIKIINETKPWLSPEQRQNILYRLRKQLEERERCRREIKPVIMGGYKTCKR